MAIRPRRRTWLKLGRSRASSGSLLGGQPPLLSSPAIFTSSSMSCTQAQLLRLAVDGPEQVLRVHRLDELHLAHHLVHLVGLKVADKVDPGPLIGPGRQVGGQLLDPVLPAHRDAGGNGRPDGVVRLYLGGGAQGDLPRVPAGGGRRRGRSVPPPPGCFVTAPYNMTFSLSQGISPLWDLLRIPAAGRHRGRWPG